MPGTRDDAGRDDVAPGGIEWGGLPSPAVLRAFLGLVSGGLAAVVGTFVLGEYQFEGLLPVGGGALFGLVVGEVVVEVGRRRSMTMAVGAGLETAGGLLGAGWISSGSGLEPLASGAWIAAGVGFAVAVVRTYDRRRRAQRGGPS